MALIPWLPAMKYIFPRKFLPAAGLIWGLPTSSSLDPLLHPPLCGLSLSAPALSACVPIKNKPYRFIKITDSIQGSNRPTVLSGWCYRPQRQFRKERPSPWSKLQPAPSLPGIYFTEQSLTVWCQLRERLRNHTTSTPSRPLSSYVGLCRFQCPGYMVQTSIFIHHCTPHPPTNIYPSKLFIPPSVA